MDWYVNWQGELVFLTPQARTSVHSLTRFSYSEWLMLEDVETVNLSIRQLMKLGEVATADTKTRSISLISAGKSAGLINQSDLVAYIVHTIKLGEIFSMHDKLPEVISLTIEYKIPLADAFEDASGIHLADNVENPSHDGEE